MRSALARVGQPEPALSLLAGGTFQLGTGSGPNPVRMIYRTEALDHVTVLSGRRGATGVWLSEAAAGRAGVRAGDRVPLGPATVPVAGVFRNLFQEPPRPYWCPYRHLIFNLANEDRDPPPLALASDPGLLQDAVGPGDVHLPVAVDRSAPTDDAVPRPGPRRPADRGVPAGRDHPAGGLRPRRTPAASCRS